MVVLDASVACPSRLEAMFGLALWESQISMAQPLFGYVYTRALSTRHLEHFSFGPRVFEAILQYQVLFLWPIIGHGRPNVGAKRY